ncbi:MAG: 5-bromo-4-chloroindolyl phosphate hydrolysis family protein [Clostridiales bacterium]|nr:5-bromo-4-chloroindolyl phosphate hydrolysis family protein [Clostridiales bacterium]
MKKELIRKSPFPFYLAGTCWLIYSLLLPFYRMTDILIAAALSAVVFLVSSKVFTPIREVVEIEESFAPSGSRQADEMISRGQTLLKEIREANQKIDRAELSDQISRLEDICRQIFREVQRRPQKAPLIRRSLDYYLPVVLKLLQSYFNMEEQKIQGENIQAAMAKIENIMDTVLKAFSTQLDGLYKDEALDISTDITVLQGMLAQEGLLSEGLQAGGSE